jgi:predicted RNase H-like nuclease (RuvC/YqgF family)
MTGFEKESTKLAFAKFAYDYVYDRSAYSVVSASLSKEAHRDELNAYVREH